MVGIIFCVVNILSCLFREVMKVKQDNKNKLASYLQAGRTVGPSTALRKINIGFFLNIDVSAESRSRMDWKSPEPAKKRTGSAALLSLHS